MLAVVQLLMTMVLVVKSEAAPTQIMIMSDGPLQLTPDMPMEKMDEVRDVRWTHRHLVLSLEMNETKCCQGRCELLRNGSLRFNTVHPEDSGSYSVEVFGKDGKRLFKRDFLLQAERTVTPAVNLTELLTANICISADSSSSVGVSVSLCCLLLFLLLVFIIIFILRRGRGRRSHTANTAGPKEENLYVMMHGYCGNKSKDCGEEKQDESVYVPCYPAMSMETPTTKQTTGEAEDIYA